MFSGILHGLGAIARPIAGAYQRRQARLQSRDDAMALIRKAELDGDTQITLSDSHWESLAQRAAPETWKDEYLTIMITLPFPMILFGGVWFAFTGDDRLLVGTNDALARLGALGVDMGELILVVVLAGIGLKAWRR